MRFSRHDSADDADFLAMKLFRPGPGPHALAVSMVGVKLGDRLLQIGCGDGGLVAALAAKTGLTGRAVAIDPSADAAARATRAAEREGVLVEIVSAPIAPLPFESGSFDVAVLLDALRPVTPEMRTAALAEVARVLRAGGRAVVVEPAARSGLAALIGPRSDPHYSADEWLRSAGFKAVRVVAERDGQRFVEGVRG
jgi:ubiquinone/menaquinone biosynthesis C-methylase UbiE